MLGTWSELVNRERVAHLSEANGNDYRPSLCSCEPHYSSIVWSKTPMHILMRTKHYLFVVTCSCSCLLKGSTQNDVSGAWMLQARELYKAEKLFGNFPFKFWAVLSENVSDVWVIVIRSPLTGEIVFRPVQLPAKSIFVQCSTITRLVKLTNLCANPFMENVRAPILRIFTIRNKNLTSLPCCRAVIGDRFRLLQLPRFARLLHASFVIC